MSALITTHLQLIVSNPTPRAPFTFVHIWPDRMDIYLNGAGVTPQRVPLPQSPGMLGLLASALVVLTTNGYALGVDGWRSPLDPKVGLVATAHLIDAPRPRLGGTMDKPGESGRGPAAGLVVKLADTNRPD